MNEWFNYNLSLFVERGNNFSLIFNYYFDYDERDQNQDIFILCGLYIQVNEYGDLIVVFLLNNKFI